jgi:hypothetical protein
MKNDLLHKFGPCGLLCEKCFAFENGPIKEHAVKLKENLGEFDNYAKRFETLLNDSRFGAYPVFKEFLNLLASTGCKGCREQECHLFAGCNVKLCYKEKGVDYCWQCAEFPCTNTGFDENLNMRWLKINEKIKEIGLENYYNSIKDKPRY